MNIKIPSEILCWDLDFTQDFIPTQQLQVVYLWYHRRCGRDVINFIYDNTEIFLKNFLWILAVSVIPSIEVIARIAIVYHKYDHLP